MPNIQYIACCRKIWGSLQRSGAGLWSIWGERLGCLRLVAQATIHGGLALDALPLSQNSYAASEVDVSGREVAEALMSLGMVVVFDKGGNRASSSPGRRAWLVMGRRVRIVTGVRR